MYDGRLRNSLFILKSLREELLLFKCDKQFEFLLLSTNSKMTFSGTFTFLPLEEVVTKICFLSLNQQMVTEHFRVSFGDCCCCCFCFMTRFLRGFYIHMPV